MSRRGRSILVALLLAAVVPLELGCPPPKSASSIDYDSLLPCQREILETTRFTSEEEMLFVLQTVRCS